MTDDDIDDATTKMPALLSRLDREGRTWRQPSPSEPPSFDKYLLPDPLRSRGIRIHVKRRFGPSLGYWRIEGGRYVFSQDVEGLAEIAVETESQAVAHTRAICVRRVGLKGTGLVPQVHSKPDGYTVWMVDVATEEMVWVFITAAALHGELDGYRGPQDYHHGKKVLEQHRHGIEQAASRKYVEMGVVEELDGKPALWVQAMDL
jgi:hypothetical protein